MSDGVSCSLPDPITHDKARAEFSKVRKDMPGLSPAAYRREAARRMGTDYDTYLAAWKKPDATAVARPAADANPITTTSGMKKLKASKGAADELRYDLEIAEGRDLGYLIDGKGNLIVHKEASAIRNIENVIDILDDRSDFDRGAGAKARALRSLVVRIRDASVE